MIIRRLIAFVLVAIALPGESFGVDCGYNFRETSAYCSGAPEAANEIAVLGNNPNDLYPQTDFNSPAECDVSYGWEDIYSDMPRNRSATYCPNAAGNNQQPNDGDASPAKFRVDLTGDLCIELGMTDATYSRPVQYFEIRDGTTVLSTCNDTDGTTSTGSDSSVTDANCNNHTTIANWQSNQTAYCDTFSSYVSIRIGNNSSGDSTLAHVRIYSNTPSSKPFSVLNAMGEL